MASPVDIGHSYYMNDIQNTIYIAYIISCILILLQVRYECGILGESWGKYIIPVLIFSWVFYLFWLTIWPGSLRLWFQGKRLKDSTMARVTDRHQQAHKPSETSAKK